MTQIVSRLISFLTSMLIVFSLMLYFPFANSITASATQVRNYNFNKNYTLTGNGATDMVNVARAQIGRNGGAFGYTEEWCADFVSDCAVLAGQSAAIPADGSCSTLQTKIKNAGGVYVDAGKAQPGDILFYGSSGGAHVEIVYANNNGVLSTIGGNSGNSDNSKSLVKDHKNQNGQPTVYKAMRPNYSGGKRIDTKVDSSYGTNRSYTATKRIYTYNVYGNMEGNRYIDSGDKCTIVEVYTSGFLKVTYPTSSGNRTAYGKTSDFNGFGPLTEDKGAVALHAWVSDKPMGDVPSRFETGGSLYLCYELKYSKSGQRIGNYDGKSYKVTETVKNPDGSKHFEYTYENSDNNWIKITPSVDGTYSGVISVSGSLTGSSTVSTKVYLKPVPALRNLISETSTGSEATKIVANKQYYLRYEFIDNNTKKLMSQSTNQYKDATFKAEIYDNSNNKIASKDFGKSESGYLAFTPKTTGTYKYKFSYSMSVGSGNIEKTFTVTNCTHSYGSWKTTKTATCTATGSKERTCSVCGNVEKQTIAKTDHKYTTKVVAPTCTAQGYTLHTCSVCNTSYKDTYKSAKGHSFGSWTTVTAATCKAAGTEKHTCSVCGTYETRSIAKKSHNYTSKVIPATTTSQGYTLHTCQVCGDSYKDNYTDKLPAVDANAAQVVVDTRTVSAGGTVTIAVSLKNNPGISGLQMKMSYNSSVLTLQSATAKNLAVTFSENLTANPYSMLWYDGLKNVTTNGAIAEFTFKVSDKAAEGSYPITIEFSDDDISDVYDKNIHFEKVNGAVNVSSHIPGDVNDDGKANVKDLIRLQQHLNGWNVTVVSGSTDINGDGKTNVKDLIRLQQFLNGWNVAVN